MEFNEGKAREAAAKGARARALLENPLLKEAFDTLEAAYVAAWRNTTIKDVGGREKVFLAINIIGKVRDHLMAVMADGELSATELRLLAETAQQKPAWHEVR